jgi:hypothetical protein
MEMMKIMLKPTVSLLGGLLLAGLCSCSNLLDELPDERVYLDTPEKIQMHLTQAYPEASFATLGEFSSDNIDDYGTDNPNFSNFEQDIVYWLDGQEYGASDGLRSMWNKYYAAVQSANTALAAINDLGGGATLNPHKGEALMIRAYAHFVLVNLFARHYNAETSATDLGVPYVLEPEVLLNPSYQRNTVKEVYELIDKDITEALPLINDNYYKEKAYHFNKDAAEAFAARFYLYYEKWAKAIEHADKVLQNKTPRRWSDFQDETVVGAKTEDAYAKLYSRSNQTANLLILPVVSSSQDRFSYVKNHRFSMTHRNANELFLGDNIWAESKSKYEDYQQEPFISPIYNYKDVIYQAKYPIYPSNGSRTLSIPFTAEETLLVRAEAKVLNADLAGAVADLNTWTQAYLKTKKKVFTQDEIVAFWKAMSYSTEEVPTMKKKLNPSFAIPEGEASEMVLHQVLQCRRIATAFEGLRWFDIRRYGITVHRYVHDRRDREKVSVVKTLTKDNPHTTFQIPQNTLNAGLTPNSPR